MSKASRVISADLNDIVSQYHYHQVSLDTDPFSLGKPIQCLCPYCQQYGEPNSKPTLYVYPETMTCYCFRCHTYGFDSRIKYLDDDIKFRQFQRQLDVNTLDRIKYPVIDVSHLPYADDEEYKDYFVTKRSEWYLPHIRDWGLRAIDFMDHKGILIPFYYEGMIGNYQIRYIDNSQQRYYTHQGVKLPYVIHGYRSNENYRDITLVEGVMDAMAADIYGLPHPVAVLGSELPEHILEFITKLLKPQRIIYAFDEMKINLRLRQALDLYLHQDFYIDTHRQDLDEYLREGKTPVILTAAEVQNNNDLLNRFYLYLHSSAWVNSIFLTTSARTFHGFHPNLSGHILAYAVT